MFLSANIGLVTEQAERWDEKPPGSAVVERWLGGFQMAKNGTLAKSHELQPSFHTTTEQITIGIDLGDRSSQLRRCRRLAAHGKQVQLF